MHSRNMKPTYLSSFSSRGRSAGIALVSAASIFSFTGAYSADFLWDADTGTGGAQDGGGTWNGTPNWISGGGNTPFVSVTAGAVVGSKTVSPFINGATQITVNDATGLVVGQEVSLGQFPSGTTIVAISGTLLTLSNGSTAAATGNVGSVSFQAPSNNATIGSGSGAAGIINLTAAQAVRKLTLNAAGSGNYSFTGTGAAGTLTVGGIRDGGIFVNSSASFGNIVNSATGGATINFSTAGQTLTFTGGGNILSVSNNGGISGTNDAIRKSSSILVTQGAYTASGTATWNIGDAGIGGAGVPANGIHMSGGTMSLGPWQIGNVTGSGYARISGGTINGTDQLSIGRDLNNTGRLRVEGGSVITNNSATNQAMVAVGRLGGSGVLDVSAGSFQAIGNGIANNGGGVMVLNSQSGNATSSGTLNISGGTVTVKDLRLNGTNQHQQSRATAGSSVVNLSGGSLYIGGKVTDSVEGATAALVTTDGGISNRGSGTSTYQINLSGGTLGANASWSSNLNMSLVSGNTTFKTANENGTAFGNITVTGQLSGAGALTVTGDATSGISGAFTLGGLAANTYSGGTTISQSTVIAQSVGALGTGDVTVGDSFDALLSLDALNAISQTASLYFNDSSTILLNYTGDQFLAGVFQADDSNQALAAGRYSADDLNAYFGGLFVFSGTGFIQIAIPEPSSTALLGLGLGSMVFLRKRRNA